MHKTKMYPMKMVPAFKDYLWGGTKLREYYGKDCILPVIAESWEVSTHPDGLSVIGNGEYAGQTLQAVTGELPFLIKLIDARKALSLQVHPNDEYARRVEGQPGKNEMWYVLEAEPEAELILGFERNICKDELRRLLERKSAQNEPGCADDIMSVVRRVPVNAGDCFCIPAGLLHAIGSGIVIAEVQQPSNVTYRVYDYGRTDSSGRTRELHTEKALDVLDTGLQAVQAREAAQTQDAVQAVQAREAAQTHDAARTRDGGGSVLSTTPADWEYFKSWLVTIPGGGAVHERTGSGFEALLVTDGALTLCYYKAARHSGSEELPLKKGESVFIPAGMGEYTLKSTTDVNSKVLFVAK